MRDIVFIGRDIRQFGRRDRRPAKQFARMPAESPMNPSHHSPSARSDVRGTKPKGQSRGLVRALWAAVILAAFPSCRAAEGSAPPAVPAVNLILDTDIGNDVDDALALGVVHALESRGACRLLAVTLTNPDPLAGEFVDAIDTFYGRAHIPIGVNPTAPSPTKSRFLKLAEARDERGRLIYPHAFDPAKAPSALAVLRRTLGAAGDGSVVIVQIGFFTNLAGL